MPFQVLLRLAANWLVYLVGIDALIGLYTRILAKFTTYVSNVVAPSSAGALCGVRINRIYFGTAPLDFGASFSFLSYAGECTLCVTSSAAAVTDPQLLADAVREAVAEQIEQCHHHGHQAAKGRSKGMCLPTSLLGTQQLTPTPTTKDMM